MKTRRILTGLATIGIVTGFCGCLGMGMALVPVTIGAIPLAISTADEALRRIDEQGLIINLEHELRSLLPTAVEKDATLATHGQPGLPPVPPVLPVKLRIVRDNRDHVGVNRDVLSTHVIITGKISPAVAQRLLEGVHQIAWRRANYIHLTIYGQEDLAENRPNDPPSSLVDFLFTPRGHTKLVDRVLNPFGDISKKLEPRVSATASLRTGPWGNRLRAHWRLDPGPQMHAWGDFSQEAAQAVIAASNAAFPDLAVTVWRDEARDPKDWKAVATYSPGKVRENPKPD